MHIVHSHYFITVQSERMLSLQECGFIVLVHIFSIVSTEIAECAEFHSGML